MSRLKNNFLTTWVEIDLKALKGNLRVIRRLSGSPRTAVLAIVKDQAYGHGMERVARALAEEGVDFFGVANIDEAAALRQVCPKSRILVLGAPHTSQWENFVKFQAIPTLSCAEDAQSFDRFLKKKNRSHAVHVKIDTGMGRLGVAPKDARRFFHTLRRCANLCPEGIYTHFSSADQMGESWTSSQLQVFQEVLRQAKEAGLRFEWVHASNSAGLLHYPQARFDLVRPGILLYGLKPSPGSRLPAGIRPVLSWRARISFIKKVEKGATISYGRTYTASAPSWIATVPVGYSHGYRVGLSNRSRMVARGRFWPAAGRVTMDQTLFCLGGGSRAPLRRWETVTLIGRSRSRGVPAEELADLLGTIPYEIVCAIHPRVPRVYRG